LTYEEPTTNIETDVDVENTSPAGSPVLTTTDDDDIRMLRASLRATLGLAKDDVQPTLDINWRRLWPALARLGVTGFCVPEALGGLGMQAHAAVAAALELGAALHGSPYAGLVASAHALGRVDDPVAQDLLAGVLEGKRICAFGRLDSACRAAQVVDGAPGADALLLVVPTSDDLILFTEPSAWSITATAQNFDVSRSCGDVEVDAARGRRIPSAASKQLHGLLLAADSLGGVQRMLARTVAYAGQRVTFGRPIGGFQAVQHRLVDHMVRSRGVALVVDEAARLLGAGSSEATRFVTLAEFGVASTALHILHELLQLSGAIGFTWEYGLHLYERRAHHDARLGANPRAAVRSLAGMEGWDR
jgi:alkylation response protein AidB-like acyl-CoA dehydrogenase